MEQAKISNKQAMEILNITALETMSRIAKKHGLSKTMQGKEAFYLKSQIEALRQERENDIANANVRAKKKERAKEFKERQMELAKTKDNRPIVKKDFNEKAVVIIKNLEKLGLFERCDISLIQTYAKLCIKIEQIEEQMGQDFTTYDEGGTQIMHPLTKIYTSFLSQKFALAKALGLGAGNRKGVKIEPMIEIDEMDKLLNE